MDEDNVENEGDKKQEDEDLTAFMKRTETAITCAMVRHHVISWDIYARRSVFKWAGWVARLAEFDPRRITLAVLKDTLNVNQLNECIRIQLKYKKNILK